MSSVPAKSNHLVSVIIPTKNRFEQLCRAVKSVQDQMVSCWEILIIDDGSEKESLGQLKAFVASHPEVYLFENRGLKGVSASRNIGIERSKGDYLLFLDDDDRLLPCMIVQSLQEILSGDFDLVSCKSEMIIVGASTSQSQLNRYNEQTRALHGLYDLSVQPQEHLLLYHPAIHTFLVKRSSIGRVRFDESYRYGEDFIFWLALAKKELRFKKMDFVGAQYWFHDSNSSIHVKLKHKLRFYDYFIKSNLKSNASLNVLNIHRVGVLLKAGKILGFWRLLMLGRHPLLTIRHVKEMLLKG